MVCPSSPGSPSLSRPTPTPWRPPCRPPPLPIPTTLRPHSRPPSLFQPLLPRATLRLLVRLRLLLPCIIPRPLPAIQPPPPRRLTFPRQPIPPLLQPLSRPPSLQPRTSLLLLLLLLLLPTATHLLQPTLPPRCLIRLLPLLRPTLHSRPPRPLHLSLLSTRLTSLRLSSHPALLLRILRWAVPTCRPQPSALRILRSLRSRAVPASHLSSPQATLPPVLPWLLLPCLVPCFPTMLCPCIPSTSR